MAIIIITSDPNKATYTWTSTASGNVHGVTVGGTKNINDTLVNLDEETDTVFYSIISALQNCPGKAQVAKVFIVPSPEKVTAQNDNIEVPSYASISGDASLNDGNANVTILDYKIISHPQNGTATMDGNGTFVYLPNPGSTSRDSLTYVVCNSCDGNKCDTATIFFKVEIKELITPNVFSPNGDGENEFFIIQGIENYSENTLQIFNRWGRKVYEKVNYNNSWNGYDSNGFKLPEGVYYYAVRFNGNKDNGSGFVELVR